MRTNASKKLKGGIRNADPQEDRLSNLPNEILINIISGLETREAVRSGILSTRWNSVWASVPILDLNQSDFKVNGSDGDHKREKARFLNFVDQVLIARKLPRLEKVRIRGQRCDPYLVRSWMRAALERDANELDVEFSELLDASLCELTHSLFSHNKLVILKLRVDMTLNFKANSCGFPNLKVLQLSSIIYSDDDSLPNLLTSCPILEDLVIRRGRNDNLGTLSLISRSVKKFKVCNWYRGKRGVVHKMAFDMPAVESLVIDCLTTERYLVKDLSRIVDAKFDICCDVIYTLLRDVSNVRFLKLSWCTVETIKLSSCEGDDCPDDEQAKILQWELLLKILPCTSKLEHLVYAADHLSGKEYCTASEWDVPHCFASSLKTVKFNYFSEDDVERVRYFLLYAQVLEKMTITDSSTSDLCSGIYENKSGPVAVTWSKESSCHIDPLLASLSS